MAYILEPQRPSTPNEVREIGYLYISLLKVGKRHSALRHRSSNALP